LPLEKSDKIELLKIAGNKSQMLSVKKDAYEKLPKIPRKRLLREDQLTFLTNLVVKYNAVPAPAEPEPVLSE
jgi:hypothetical protein